MLFRETVQHSDGQPSDVVIMNSCATVCISGTFWPGNICSETRVVCKKRKRTKINIIDIISLQDLIYDIELKTNFNVSPK